MKSSDHWPHAVLPDNVDGMLKAYGSVAYSSDADLFHVPLSTASPDPPKSSDWQLVPLGRSEVRRWSQIRRLKTGAK